MSAAFSWLAAGMAMILVLLYPARILLQKRKAAPHSLPASIYKVLRKVHIAVGILMIPVVYLHCGLAGRISGKRSTFGVALAVLLLLLAVSYFLRKWIGKHWKRLHQFLAAILVMVTLYHSFIEFM